MASNCHLVRNKENPACIDTAGSMNDDTSGGHENHQIHLIRHLCESEVVGIGYHRVCAVQVPAVMRRRRWRPTVTSSATRGIPPVLTRRGHLSGQ